MEKTKIKLEVGKRVLYHIAGKGDILEGVISNVSPSGLFKIGERWFCEGSMYGHGEAIKAEILDELPASDIRRVPIGR